MQTHYELTTLAGLFVLPPMQIALKHAAKGNYERAIEEVESYLAQQPLFDLCSQRQDEQAHLSVYALARTAQWWLEQNNGCLAVATIEQCVRAAQLLWGSRHETSLVMRSFALLIATTARQVQGKPQTSWKEEVGIRGKKLAEEIKENVAPENPLRAELLERVARAMQESDYPDLAESLLVELLQDYWVWEEEGTYSASNARRSLLEIWLQQGQIDAHKRLVQCQVDVLEGLFGHDDVAVITRLRRLAVLIERNEWECAEDVAALWAEIELRCSRWSDDRERGTYDEYQEETVEEIWDQARKRVEAQAWQRVDKH